MVSSGRVADPSRFDWRVRTTVPDAGRPPTLLLQRPRALPERPAGAPKAAPRGRSGRRGTSGMTRRGPQEGSIYLRQDGRWEGALHLGYENGRRVRKFVLGNSRKEAAEKLQAI